MITIKDWMELVDYRISETAEYCWRCFGDNAQVIDSWMPGDDGYNISMIFDRRNQTVYQIEACDYRRARAYRWTHPDFRAAHKRELQQHIDDTAYDDVAWIDLELAEDFMSKASAIVNQQDYDTRVKVPLDLDREEWFELMQRAHERDITLNQLVEEILQAVIDRETSSAK